MELAQLYTSLRPKMMGIAYHMLGTAAEAEDMVQDVFATLQAMDTHHVEREQAYVLRMLVNRCRNHLTSARRKREVYIGPWLPEPLVGVDNPATFTDADPLHVIERSEALSYALMVLVERLSPLERAVFVLREVFGYEYREIASMVDKSIVHCRKIFSRALQNLRYQRDDTVDTNTSYEILAQQFTCGMSTGDFGDFIHSFVEDVQMITDGGGKTKAAMYPVYGSAKVARFLQGLYHKGTFSGPHFIVKVNGVPGVLLYKKQQPYSVISFACDAERITRVYMVVNPEKLQHVPRGYGFFCEDCRKSTHGMQNPPC